MTARRGADHGDRDVKEARDLRRDVVAGVEELQVGGIEVGPLVARVLQEREPVLGTVGGEVLEKPLRLDGAEARCPRW